MAKTRSADFRLPACFRPPNSRWMTLARVLRCRQGLTTFVRHLERPQEPHRRQETRFQRRFGATMNVKSTHFGGIFGGFSHCWRRRRAPGACGTLLDASISWGMLKPGAGSLPGSSGSHSGRRGAKFWVAHGHPGGSKFRVAHGSRNKSGMN